MDVDPEYMDCYLQACQDGTFTGDDVELNKISQVDTIGASKFVAEHERILSQKRMLLPEVRCLHSLCFPLFDK